MNSDKTFNARKPWLSFPEKLHIDRETNCRRFINVKNKEITAAEPFVINNNQ